MKSKLERSLGFSGIVTLLTILSAIGLMRASGIWAPNGWAQFLVYVTCILGLQRCLSFVGWLLVLWLAPPGKLRDAAIR